MKQLLITLFLAVTFTSVQAAEVLLNKYPTADKRDIDALAWLCRALGNSHNSRYYSALNEVVIDPEETGYP